MNAFVGTLVLLAGLTLAAPAAVVLLPFHATLSVRFSTIRVELTGVGGVASVNGSGGGGHLTQLALSSGAIQGTPPVVAVTDPAAFPISGVALQVSNAAGAFAEFGGGGFGGPMGLPGFYRVCLFGPGGCASPPANLDIPLTVIGNGGSGNTTGPVVLTVFGSPWTTATASIGVTTEMGFRSGPLSGTSSTAQPGGRVRLVTPIYVSTNIGASAVIPAFATLTLHFVPEPGTIALLGAGVALLAGAGARRRRAPG